MKNDLQLVHIYEMFFNINNINDEPHNIWLLP